MKISQQVERVVYKVVSYASYAAEVLVPDRFMPPPADHDCKEHRIVVVDPQKSAVTDCMAWAKFLNQIWYSQEKGA